MAKSIEQNPEHVEQSPLEMLQNDIKTLEERMRMEKDMTGGVLSGTYEDYVDTWSYLARRAAMQNYLLED